MVTDITEYRKYNYGVVKEKKMFVFVKVSILVITDSDKVT